MIEWFEDLSLGMRFKSEPVQISEDDIKQFAAKFDPQPFHLDDEAARETIFKGLAASGWHTAAIGHEPLCESSPVWPPSADRSWRWTAFVGCCPSDLTISSISRRSRQPNPFEDKASGNCLVKWTFIPEGRSGLYVHAG